MSRNEKLKDLIVAALDSKESATPRSQQSRAGVLGPSDIGFCRQKTALVVRQVAPTDSVPKWSAAVGTAMHTYIEAALKEAHSDWLVGSIDKIETTTLLPSGAEIKGHPDVVVPASNAVLDIKTVDGFEWIKRNGPSQSHIYQRHLYAMGLVQMGLLSPDNLLVGNVYFDRSGKESEPIVLVEQYDPALTSEIDQWVQDVIYAVKHNEDAARDVAAPVCERICEFFTVCRGSLEVHDGQEIIRDDTLLSAIDMYLAGRDMESQGKQMKKEASERLSNVTGMTSTHQVRWVHVGPTTISQTERAAHERLDIRRRRRA